MRLEFLMPVPPSTNTAYFNRGGGQGRGKTKPSRVYATNALMALQPVLNANKQYCDNVLLQRMGIMRDGGVNALSKTDRRHAVTTIQNGVKDCRPSYGMIYVFHFPDRIPRDLANFEKLLTDVMVEAGILLDDQFIDVMLLVRGKTDGVRPCVRVIIEDLTGKNNFDFIKKFVDSENQGA